MKNTNFNFYFFIKILTKTDAKEQDINCTNETFWDYILL